MDTRRIWTGMATVAVVAVAALVVGTVALVRGQGNATPTYTETEVNAATESFCTIWSIAARSIRADTNRVGVPAIARVAQTNAAAPMEAAGGVPALPERYRDAAVAFAQAERVLTAVSSTEDRGTPGFDAAVGSVSNAGGKLVALCP